MRSWLKIGAFLGILVKVGYAACDSSLTPTSTTRIGLQKPQTNSCSWGTTLNSNFDILDSSIVAQGVTNTFTSTNTFNQPLIMGTTQPIRFSDASTHYIGLQSPNSVTTTLFYLPTADGSNGQVMQTNGSGQLSFVAPGNASSLLSTTNTWTATQAFNSLLTLNNELDASNGAGTNGYILKSNGSGASPTWIAQNSLGPGDTNYIQNTASLQSNSTFYVSSGTVNTRFTANLIVTTNPISEADQFSNVGYGQFTFSTPPSGSFNVGFGSAAMTGVGLSGSYNSAFGDSALTNQGSGLQNTGVGYQALFSNTSAQWSTSVGANSLYSSTGNGNTAIGYISGQGVAPSTPVTSGTFNTFVGYNAQAGAATQLTNATAIGANAIVSSSNTMQLGSNVTVNMSTFTASSGTVSALAISSTIVVGSPNAAADSGIKLYIPSVTTLIKFLGYGAQPTMAFRYKDDSSYEIGQIDADDLRILDRGTIMSQFAEGHFHVGDFKAIANMNYKTEIENHGGPALYVDGYTNFISSITVSAPISSNYEIKLSTSTTTFHVAVSTFGHLVTFGPSPTISSCGSTPNGSVVGDDNQGTITVGGGSVTACTLTFASSWVSTPICTITDNSTAITGDISSISATAFTSSFSLSIGGGTIYYRCGCSGTGCK